MSGEPTPDERHTASGPAGTETSITPATARERESVMPPSLALQPSDASGSVPQGHYSAALDRVLGAYAVLFIVGAISLLLLLGAVAALSLRARRRAADSGKRAHAP